MSTTSKSIIKREKNRRYGKKSKIKNNPATTVPLESLDRFAGSSEEEDNNNDNYDDDDDDDDRDNDAAIQPDMISDDKIHNKSSKTDQRLDRDSRMVKSPKSISSARIPNNNVEADEYEGGNESDSDNDNDDSDEEEENDAESYNNEGDEIASQLQLTSGMANAMNRILSTAPKTSKTADGTTTTSTSTSTTTAAVVLSKTKTPLQIQAEKEKKLQESLKENRRVKRERQIKALHIPLTVATNSFVAAAAALHNNSTANQQASSSSLTMELEMERMHRRVATRGIVALFNAIAHHQVRPDQTALAAAAAATTTTTSNATSDASNKKSATSSNKLTKNGFLDLIKQKAMTSTSIYDAKTPKSVAVVSSKITGTATSNNNNLPDEDDDQKGVKKWNALKDDYMLDSTKNWDELDDSDENDDNEEDHRRNKKSSHHSHQLPRKKQRHDSRN